MSRKNKRNNNGKTTLTIILLAILGIIVWFYMSREAKPHSRVDSTNTLEYTDHGDIEYVKLPDGIKSQILEYPGFTVSFNSEYHQPNYVVWELTGDEMRTNVVGKRTEKFQPDPEVDGCPTLDDYRGSGYERGHMAPAGDMKWSTEANDASFLLTNMSPQHHDLNAGSWLSLEEKCRGWAIRDSAIVIVCGPILSDELTRHIGRSSVPVPERFFKVILSPFSDPPRGIGFIMPNTLLAGDWQSTAVSIDEVERVTGFDFFSALPDDIEDTVEAECNYPKWNFRRRR